MLSLSVPVPPVALLVDGAGEELQVFVLDPVFRPVPVAPLVLELLAPVDVSETSDVPPTALFVPDASNVAEPLMELDADPVTLELLELLEVLVSTSVPPVASMLLLVASVPVVPVADVSVVVVDDDDPLWMVVLS